MSKPKWSVSVLQFGPQSFKTVFAVAHQSFELACMEDDAEAQAHCEFIAAMFLMALGKLGIDTTNHQRLRIDHASHTRLGYVHAAGTPVFVHETKDKSALVEVAMPNPDLVGEHEFEVLEVTLADIEPRVVRGSR